MDEDLRNELPLRGELAITAWGVLERDATQSMVNTQRADVIADALLPIVARRIAQARAETAESIAVAIEAHYDPPPGVPIHCARIARQHAEPEGIDDENLRTWREGQR